MFYKNFTLAEMTYSNTALHAGIENTPTADEIAHLGELTGSILQPLREAWGKPIKVTSGFRCKALNAMVGGVGNSAHLYGLAADIQPQDMADFEMFVNFTREWLRVNNIAYDQCIIEKSGDSRWVHIGVRDGEGKQRRQCFNIFV